MFCNKLDSSVNYFPSLVKEPYDFTADVMARFCNATVRSQPPIILGDMIDDLISVGVPSRYFDDLEARSKYTPGMLLEPSQKYDAGGVMGNYDAKLLARAVQQVAKRFKLYEKVKPLDLRDVPYDGTKNSGLPWLQRKEKVAEEALRNSVMCWKGKCPPPVIMFHRGKNERVARPVFAVPFEWMLVEGAFYYPLHWAIQSMNTPYFGGKHYVEIGATMNRIRNESEYVIQLDYSGFDGSISSKLIGYAFSILQDNIEFPDNRSIKVFERVRTYFTTSPILCPDGYVYKGRRHGVISGSMFTQLIDSLVNCICIEYMALKSSLSIGRYVVVGDDSVISAVGKTTNITRIAETLKELGIVVNVKKSKISSPQDSVHFLGHDWHKIVPSRDPAETYARLVTPERPLPEFFSRNKRVRANAYRERVRAYADDNTTQVQYLRAVEVRYMTVYMEDPATIKDRIAIGPDLITNIPVEKVEHNRWREAMVGLIRSKRLGERLLVGYL